MSVELQSRQFTRTEMQRALILLLHFGCWFEVDPTGDEFVIWVRKDDREKLLGLDVLGPPPLAQPVEKKHYILPIESFDGEDLIISVLFNEPSRPPVVAYAIVETDENGAEIIDNGYRSHEEAKQAWPEAK